MMNNSREHRRRFLQIAIEPFDRPVSGADLRNAAVHQALSRLGAVSVIALRPPRAAAGSSEPPKRTISTVTEISEEVAQSLREQVLAARPDAVIFEGVGTLRAAECLATFGGEEGVPFVGDCHNVESFLSAEIERAKWPGPLRSLAAWAMQRRWKRLREADRAFAALMTRIWVCSHDDDKRLGDLGCGDVPIDVVPNATPSWCDAEAPKDRLPGGSPVFLFAGHLRYPPNVRAALFLCRSIWPLVKERLPDARLIIAGRSPNRRIAQAATGLSGIKVIADPPDMRAIYEKADCAVIPLTEGGGTRIKVLEAFAMRTAVVATAKAVEGLRIADGTHFIAAETAEQFASALAGLFSEPGKVDAMTARAERYAREFHSEHAVQTAVAKSIRDLGL